MIIDSHQHFWDRSQPSPPYDYSWQDDPVLAPIRRTYLPSDLAPHLNATGVNYSIFVQAQHHLDETRWALKLAEKNATLAGVVGWVDLASPDCEAQLDEFVDHPSFAGIRHVVQDEPDDDFIVRDDIVRGLKVLERKGVPYDLLFYTKHLRHAATLGGVLPELPMVINHLSKPEIKAGNIDEWREDLQAAAERPNIYCKLSGMITEADWENWSVDDLRPYVESAVEAFGVERCMFGSDWPVCELAGTYEQVFNVLSELISELSDDEQARILGGTAAAFYGLNV
jgi:L-fuconolactonase